MRTRAWPPPPNDELRFEVGKRVECCVGKDHWEPGTVVALWYTEEGFPPGFYAPYQVELDMGNLIFAPDDRCIRALLAVAERVGRRRTGSSSCFSNIGYCRIALTASGVRAWSVFTNAS